MEQEEKQKLEQAKERFHLQELTKDLAEFLKGRNLSDDEWQAYTKSEYGKNKNPKDNVYSIKQLFKEPKVKRETEVNKCVWNAGAAFIL